MEIRGSLSRIVPVAEAPVTTELVAPLRLTENISVDSARRSPSTATGKVWLVLPAAIVTVASDTPV